MNMNTNHTKSTQVNSAKILRHAHTRQP